MNEKSPILSLRISIFLISYNSRMTDFKDIDVIGNFAQHNIAVQKNITSTCFEQNNFFVPLIADHVTKLEIGLYLENQTFLVNSRHRKKCSTLNYLPEKTNCVIFW